MTAESISIKIAYEQLGMSPEEISLDRSLQLVSVKASLMATSKQYRLACGQEGTTEDKLNFTDEDTVDVLEVIRHTAKYAEDENLRLKAAIFIRNDRKGRLEPAKMLGGDSFNIFNFNEQIAKIREMKNRSIQKVVDV